MSSIKQVVIFKGSAERSDDAKDPYVEKIEALNIKCHVIPVLSFEFINEADLKARLDNAARYTGIIFSSPRCVASVQTLVNLSEWANKDIYVVGNRTAQSAAELGLTRVQGQDSGNGLALADFILKEKKRGCRLLVPASDISRDVMVKRLQDEGVEVDQIVVYRTLPNKNLETELARLDDGQQVDVMLFFSPSGVDAVSPYLTKYKTDTIKFGAIGATTEEALRKHSLPVSFVAEKPNPDYVVKALNNIISQ